MLRTASLAVPGASLPAAASADAACRAGQPARPLRTGGAYPKVGTIEHPIRRPRRGIAAPGARTGASPS